MKFSSKLIAAGAVALLVGAFVPHSSARAQDGVPCGDSIYNSVAPAEDKAERTIYCAEFAECRGVTCKEESLRELEDCLGNANSTVAKQLCDQRGLAGLQACIATVTRDEAGCLINPTVPMGATE